MKPIRVLVTGAGSGVGQGIVKALRASSLPICIISADVSPLNAALFRSDEGIIIPKVESDGALKQVILLLKQHRIDVVMVGSEFDLEFFAKYKERIEGDTGILIIVSPLSTVQIANDKWLTAEFLRENGLPYAESYLPAGINDALDRAHQWGYPLMLKTRKGTSNRHVHVVSTAEQLQQQFATVPMPMIQKLIDVPTSFLNTEYTCSIFKCSDGSLLGPFTGRRTLRGGNSWIVEVADFKELHPLLLSVGRNLDVMGSLNIQLMMGGAGPVPFEFNARFSGTTAVRAHYGFNEPDMALRNYFLGEKAEPPEIRHGLALRYLEEVFVEGVSAVDLTLPFPTGLVRPWF
jgi:carbamoyl-phosphate synthase large subunit